MWRFMQESRFPDSAEEAIDRVLNSEKGFAFIGKLYILWNTTNQKPILFRWRDGGNNILHRTDILILSTIFHKPLNFR